MTPVPVAAIRAITFRPSSVTVRLAPLPDALRYQPQFMAHAEKLGLTEGGEHDPEG